MAMGYHKIECFNNEQIESIRGKTIYFVGDDDPFAKLGGKKSLIENKMNVKFFPEVGHGINHEIAEEINRLVSEFIFS
jgi:pimeloyl-ACP methyl ester carboxylesterase